MAQDGKDGSQEWKQYREGVTEETCDAGALIIGIGVGGLLYCSHVKEPPKPYSNINIKAPI